MQNYKFDETLPVSTAQLCQFSQLAASIPLSLPDTGFLARKDDNPCVRIVGVGALASRIYPYEYFQPDKVDLAQWSTPLGREVVTAERNYAGQWQIHYLGDASEKSTYFPILSEVVPWANPAACISYRLLRAAVRLQPESLNQRQRLLAKWTDALIKAADPNTAIDRMEPEVRDYLDDIPRNSLFHGVKTLRKRLAIPA